MAIKFFKGWKIGNNTYKVQDERADNLGTASTKNSTSVVTESSDLVESGAVKKAIVDTVGWIGENLFNSNVSLTEFVYIKDDGTTGASGDWYLTDYIEVVGGLKLIINDYAPSAVVNPSICWYTDNKTYIAGQKYNAQFPVVVDLPTNAKYVRLSIHKDRLNDITVLYPTVNETKADNSVIAPVENGSATSQAYAVGSHAIRNGAFITWKNAKSQGETINDASDYTSGDVASALPRIGRLNGIKLSDLTWTQSGAGMYYATVANIGQEHTILSANFGDWSNMADTDLHFNIFLDGSRLCLMSTTNQFSNPNTSINFIYLYI